MIRDPWLRALVIVMCAIAGIYLVGLVWQVLQQVADILLLFFLAWLVAFVLEPLVLLMHQGARVPRVLAIGVTYLALLVLLSLGVILLVPALTAQLVEVARNLPTYAEQMTDWVTGLQTSLNAWLLDHHSPVMLDVRLALSPDDLTRRTEALGPPLLSNAVQLATSAATLLLELVILVILSFYFMVDGPRLGEMLVLALPARAQDDTRYLFANVHRAFAGFLRGQVIQALVSGFGTWLLMSLLKVDYALLSGVVAGVFLLIPFLGPIVAVLLPVTVALLTRPDVAVILLVLLVALQQLILNVIAPRILSRQVGLHPLLVFFAVLAGARVAGVWGAIFGVPVVAVVAAMISFYRGSREERVARLQEHLPGQDLVSVDVSATGQAREPEQSAPIPPHRREVHRP